MGRSTRSPDDIWTFSRPGQKVQWPSTKWSRANIGKRLRYSFVQGHWDRRMADLAKLDRLKAEPSDPVAPRLTDGDRAVFDRAREAGVQSLMDFLDRVRTRESAEAFCLTSGIAPAHLIDLLRKVAKYLPFGAQMRQLVDEDDPVYEQVDRLVANKLGFSLALLERGRTKEGRRALSKDTGIPMRPLLDLVRRADLTRLHLMGGGMVRTSWALGFRGLAALKKTTGPEFYRKMEAYYRESAGGRPFDFTQENAESHIQRMKEAVDILEE